MRRPDSASVRLTDWAASGRTRSADDTAYSIHGTTTSPPGLWHSEGGNRDSGRGRQSGGIQSFGEHNGWDRHDDTSHVCHTRHNRPDWPTLVEQHSPGLLADQNMSLPVGGGPISAVTEAPRLDYFSRHPPSRPGRGYGAGPAALKGGSTGLVIASTTTTPNEDRGVTPSPEITL